MKWVRWAAALTWTFMLPIEANAEHNSLLPRPYQIRYGTGRLPLRNLGIRFASAPSAEDRFTANQLASALSIRAGVPVAIWESPATGHAIVLRRTGAVEALPVPDERTGPDSREAYLIEVTPEAAEIRARSSAGVFYGIQTLCQLAEGEGDRAALPEVEIRDWPSLFYRGTMVDMSHGALPTEEEVK